MKVMDGYAKCIFTRIGGNRDVDYPEEIVECLTSEGFLERNQPKYLRRCKRLGLGARRQRYPPSAKYHASSILG